MTYGIMVQNPEQYYLTFISFHFGDPAVLEARPPKSSSQQGDAPSEASSAWPAVLGLNPHHSKLRLRRNVASFSVCLHVSSPLLIRTPVIGFRTPSKAVLPHLT